MGGLPASLSLRLLIYEMETVLLAHADEMDEDKEGTLRACYLAG